MCNKTGIIDDNGREIVLGDTVRVQECNSFRDYNIVVGFSYGQFNDSGTTPNRGIFAKQRRAWSLRQVLRLDEEIKNRFEIINNEHTAKNK